MFINSSGSYFPDEVNYARSTMSEKRRAVGTNCASHPDSFGDRFRVLTDDLLRHILFFLPANEAVQTCVLGQHWCNLWKTAPGLRIVCGGENEPESVKEIQVFMYHLLLLRGDAPLETCVIYLNDVEYDEMLCETSGSGMSCYATFGF
ncbi:hypothetical protein EJB05_14471, partial [Eragrostis curvula]